MDGGDEGDVLSGSDGVELTGRIEDIDSGGCRLLDCRVRRKSESQVWRITKRRRVSGSTSC